MRFYFFAALFNFLFLGCQKKDHPVEVAREEILQISLNEVGSEIMLPSQLFKTVEAEINSKVNTFSFFPIKIKLKETNRGVLKQPEILLEFQKGGGEIDLNSYLGQTPGSFNVFFDFEKREYDHTRVFFISRAKKHKLEDGLWGLGCDKFVEITSFFNKTMEKNGIKVNSTRSRHASVLGGHFIFLLNNGKRVILSQVTFKDSGVPDFFCPASTLKK